MPISSKIFTSTNNGIDQAIRHIYSTYGDIVSPIVKQKSLLKFGRHNNLGTSFETVWTQTGHETYATGNDIDSISSSNTGDTQTVVVEGHTVSGSELTFVVQSVTLTGQTTATLSTPLYRATRLYNNGSTNFAGDIYVYESGGTVTAGVPQTAADIHLKCPIGNNQSLKAATSISNVDYWIVTEIGAGVNRQQSRSVDFRFQIREFGKVFRTHFVTSAHSNSGAAITMLDPPLIVPRNADMRIIAVSSSTGTGVEAHANGYLASVIT